MNDSTHDHQANGKDLSSNPKRSLDSNGNSKKSDRSKRFRVSRACDQCRAGREKCDGAQPTCQTCESQDRSCSYNEQPKKRGIQPNYIRTLELTLEWILQHYPESERALSQRLPEPTDPAYQLIAFKNPAADAMHQDWRNGIICRQIDQLLSGTEIEKRVESQADAQLSGSPKLKACPTDAPNPTAVSAEGIPSPTRANSGRLSHTDIGEGVLKLPENAWSLLEHYFAFTQTFLPITEKHDILKLMYSYPAAGLRISEATAPEHAELWSIMTWSSFHLNDVDSDHVAYQKVAQSLVSEKASFEISHVKALLVLSLVEMTTSSWNAAWLTIGSAIRILTYIIAGVPFELVSTSGRTRHTLLAAFLLETTVAAQTGCLPHLPTTMVQTIGLPVEDGIEEWSPWSDPTLGSTFNSTKMPARSISTFNELVRTALRYRSSNMKDQSRFDVMKKLLQNAASGHSRDNPSKLLMEAQASMIRTDAGARPQSIRDSSTPSLAHVRSDSSAGRRGAPNHPDFTANFPPNAILSFPTEGTESIAESTPVQQPQSAATPNLWYSGYPSAGPDQLFSFEDSTANVGPRADIFEELAMLDPAEENPKFMQNLGFGPDLDLAEFFGEDYLPTDLLMYSQSVENVHLPENTTQP